MRFCLFLFFFLYGAFRLRSVFFCRFTYYFCQVQLFCGKREKKENFRQIIKLRQVFLRFSDSNSRFDHFIIFQPILRVCPREEKQKRILWRKIAKKSKLSTKNRKYLKKYGIDAETARGAKNGRRFFFEGYWCRWGAQSLHPGEWREKCEFFFI